MYTLKIKCKTITPLFMAGADGKTPELRPSEFKGMMRWWWRAIRAEDDISTLREEEAKIFGGTGENEGKSKVQIKIKPNDVPPQNRGNNLKNDYNLEWFFDQKINALTGRHAGIGYLLYSTVLPKLERSYVKEAFEFEIVLSAFGNKVFNNAYASFWLATYLGGFGTRARRGGGNIEIIKTEGNPSIQFRCDAKNEKELKLFLQTNIEQIRKICESKEGTQKYTNSSTMRILILENKNNWQEALNFLGKLYMNFRNKNKERIFETASFGMPVIHSGFLVRMVPYSKEKNLSDRYASPIIFKIIKSNNLYFPLIVKLSAGGVSHVGKEIRRNRGWILEKSSIRSFSENLIDEFLNSLNKKEELIL